MKTSKYAIIFVSCVAAVAVGVMMFYAGNVDDEKGNNQVLRVHMANIRRKIEKNPAEPEYIFTEVGVGYRMAEEE